MTAAIIAISIILTGFVNGLHHDVCGCSDQRYYCRNSDGHAGAPGRPEDWPDDGAGCHSGSQKWKQSEENDDDFVGAQ